MLLYQAYLTGMWSNYGLQSSMYNVYCGLHNLQELTIAVNSGKKKYKPKPPPTMDKVIPKEIEWITGETEQKPKQMSSADMFRVITGGELNG